MGLPEYQAMPSLRDVAHNATGIRYGKGRQYGQSITYKITPAGSLSSRPSRGPPCWASPIAFGLIACDPAKKQIAPYAEYLRTY